MLGSVRFFQISQREIFVSDDGVSGAIVTCRAAIIQLQVAESVIAQFVHQAVQKCRGTLRVDSELAVFCKVVAFLQRKRNLDDKKQFFYPFAAGNDRSCTIFLESHLFLDDPTIKKVTFFKKQFGA